MPTTAKVGSGVRMFRRIRLRMIAPGRAFVVGRGSSIGCALRGIVHLVRTEKNAWVHAGATVLVVMLSFALHLRREEWCWIVTAMVGVWAAEALNTAIEWLCDVVNKEHHAGIGRVKDVAAGAVLMVTAGAAVIGLLVLGPHVWEWVAMTAR